MFTCCICLLHASTTFKRTEHDHMACCYPPGGCTKPGAQQNLNRLLWVDWKDGRVKGWWIDRSMNKQNGFCLQPLQNVFKVWILQWKVRFQMNAYLPWPPLLLSLPGIEWFINSPWENTETIRKLGEDDVRNYSSICLPCASPASSVIPTNTAFSCPKPRLSLPPAVPFYI